MVEGQSSGHAQMEGTLGFVGREKPCIFLLLGETDRGMRHPHPQHTCQLFSKELQCSSSHWTHLPLRVTPRGSRLNEQ